MAGSCSERERARQNSNPDVATQTALPGKGKVTSAERASCPISAKVRSARRPADAAATSNTASLINGLSYRPYQPHDRGVAAADSGQRHLAQAGNLNLRRPSRD